MLPPPPSPLSTSQLEGHTEKTKDTNEEVNTYTNPTVGEAVQDTSGWFSSERAKKLGMWRAETDKGGRWSQTNGNSKQLQIGKTKQ